MAQRPPIPIIDTMIGFGGGDAAYLEKLRAQIKEPTSREGAPIQYLFGQSIPVVTSAMERDPIAVTLEEMDRFGIAHGMISCDTSRELEALHRRPDRFIPASEVDPNDIMGSLRKMDRLYKEIGLKAVVGFPAGFIPPCPIDDRRYYPIYAKCCELDIPIFLCAGVPGPRLPMTAQHVERIDNVMYDFPDLRFVTRHGCEPWVELMVKLMIRWPNLYYSTSAFAPKHYPRAILDYMNTRGADKIMYAGYYPYGLTLERIMSEMDRLDLKPDVWPKFLRENAARVLKLE